MRHVTKSADHTRVRRRYDQMTSGHLVSALVHNRLSESNAEIAREILWEREAREERSRVRLRGLRDRIRRDEHADPKPEKMTTAPVTEGGRRSFAGTWFVWGGVVVSAVAALLFGWLT